MKKVLSILLPIAAAVGLVGCGGSGGGLVNVPNPRVRFVNAFTGVDTVKARVGQDVLGGSIKYGESTDYVITDNGTKSVTAGQNTYDDLATLTNQDYEDDKRYTAVGYGGAGERAIALLGVNESGAPNDTVSLRVFNALNTNSVDVYITNEASGGSLPNDPTVAGITSGTASIYKDINVGTASSANIRIRAYPAGTRLVPVQDRTITLSEGYRGTAILLESGASSRPLLVQDND